MESHQRRRTEKNSSGDSFSFPSTPPNQDSSADDADDFEFGSLTPDSPSSDPSRASPADHLFFNGRLLPHSFPPLQPHPTILLCDHNSRATSRSSSKDSHSSLVLSSRSNSTNSRSSSCSSARTSSSDSSERRLFYNRVSSSGGRAYQGSKMAYGCSQRWQYITPVPAAALSRDASRRRTGRKEEVVKKTKREDQKSRVGRRLFRWLVMACKECHALEPSRKDEMLQENGKL